MHDVPSNITRDGPPITRDDPPSILILQGRPLTVVLVEQVLEHLQRLVVRLQRHLEPAPTSAVVRRYRGAPARWRAARNAPSVIIARVREGGGRWCASARVRTRSAPGRCAPASSGTAPPARTSRRAYPHAAASPPVPASGAAFLGTRPNISESHSELSTRVPYCITGAVAGRSFEYPPEHQRVP